MTPSPDDAGAWPVGTLDGLPPLGALAVRALRRWCDGGEAALAADLGPVLGAPRGDAAAEALGALCGLCLAAARRPLLRHGGACPCLGADEAAFAELVRQATEGEREDALMLACCLVRADLAPALVERALMAGIHLLRALAGSAASHGSGGSHGTALRAIGPVLH